MHTTRHFLLSYIPIFRALFHENDFLLELLCYLHTSICTFLCPAHRTLRFVKKKKKIKIVEHKHHCLPPKAQHWNLDFSPYSINWEITTTLIHKFCIALIFTLLVPYMDYYYNVVAVLFIREIRFQSAFFKMLYM